MVTQTKWHRPRRRDLLVAMASAVAMAGLHPARAQAIAAPRLAAIDWAMAESAIMLGQPPVALAELPSFAEVTTGALSAGLLPADTVDLGLRGGPNLEALSLVGPDLILSSGYYRFFEPQLARVAPVFTRDLFIPGAPPLPKIIAVLTELAARIEQPLAAVQAQEWLANRLGGLQHRALPHAERPYVVIEIGDSRHIRAYGADSLFVGTLAAIGLRNAWTQGTKFAFSAPVPMQALVAYPDAHIVITGDTPVQVVQGLRRSALWNALPAVRAGRVTRLPHSNGFGGALSALRFATLLVDALEGRG